MLDERTNEILSRIYDRMEADGIDVCILTNNDPHFSENPAEHWFALKFLLGFHDKNGVLVIYRRKGFFFTDGRFASEFVPKFKDSDIKFCRINGDAEEAAFSFLADYFGSRKFIVAFDYRTVHVKYLFRLSGNADASIRNVDLLAPFWTERPALVQYNVSDIEDMVFPDSYDRIYVSRLKKLNLLVRTVNSTDENIALMFADADDIAWLLNIRSFENRPSMLVPAFFLLYRRKGYLFIQGKVDNRLKHDFSSISDDENSISSIAVFDYDDFFTKAHFLLPGGTKIFEMSDVFCAHMASVFSVNDYPHFPFARGKFELIKAVRTDEEVKAVKLAFVEDAKAFFSLILHKNELTDEMGTVKKLHNLMEKSEYFITESFPTICGFAENGAICHYEPDEKTNRKIGRGLVVLDFGSQYDFGTTDNTRTLLFGKASGKEKRLYTAVLKAHIYLQRITLRIGIEGNKLDAVVRGMLYEYDVDIPHGVGHGVSMLGPVHGNIPRLSSQYNFASGFSVLPGMVFTIEPGAYLENEFGIRIENTVVAAALPDKKGYMKLEPLTLCPYERKLIDKSMLSRAEVKFINDYHRKVYEALEGGLDAGDRKHLKKLCRHI